MLLVVSCPFYVSLAVHYRSPMPDEKRGGGLSKCLSCSSSVSLITPLASSLLVPKHDKYRLLISLTQLDAVEWLNLLLLSMYYLKVVLCKELFADSRKLAVQTTAAPNRKGRQRRESIACTEEVISCSE